MKYHYQSYGSNITILTLLAFQYFTEKLIFYRIFHRQYNQKLMLNIIVTLREHVICILSWVASLNLMKSLVFLQSLTS